MCGYSKLKLSPASSASLNLMYFLLLARADHTLWSASSTSKAGCRVGPCSLENVCWAFSAYFRTSECLYQHSNIVHTASSVNVRWTHSHSVSLSSNAYILQHFSLSRSCKPSCATNVFTSWNRWSMMKVDDHRTFMSSKSCNGWPRVCILLNISLCFADDHACDRNHETLKLDEWRIRDPFHLPWRWWHGWCQSHRDCLRHCLRLAPPLV